jgi:tetratricopeptide (TPR) repeat protein
MVAALMSRLDKGLKECKGADCEPWKAVESYAPGRLEYFEQVRDFYDCDYYVGRYMPNFDEAPMDCDVIETTYTRLRWAKCDPESEAYVKVNAAYMENCYEPAPVAIGPGREGYNCLQDNDYRCAIDKFTEAAEGTDDSEKKGKYYITVAKIYYSHLKNFRQARAFARKAAAAQSGWGEPYLLIGRLYASSGPLCGPGRGFDSQIVVWPAIDMWNRAKNVDSAAAAEANKFINRYTQYMPSREDVFQRGLKVGATFKVGCWIQESTIIRTP